MRPANAVQTESQFRYDKENDRIFEHVKDIYKKSSVAADAAFMNPSVPSEKQALEKRTVRKATDYAELKANHSASLLILTNIKKKEHIKVMFRMDYLRVREF